MYNKLRKTKLFDAGYKHSCICIHEIDKERDANIFILLNQIVIYLVLNRLVRIKNKNGAKNIHIFMIRRVTDSIISNKLTIYK